jgi:hypothetical protein
MIARTFAILLGFVLLPSVAGAQTAEAGVHYSAISMEYPDQARSGVGGFFVYSPLAWFGVDTAATFYFDEPLGGNAWQLQAGPRVGMTWRDLSVFVRVRPGVIRFSERIGKPNIPCILIFPPPEACLAPKTNFALDLGGTVEVPVGGAARLRFDLGDALIRYDRNALDPQWMHSLQFTAGVGWGW